MSQVYQNDLLYLWALHSKTLILRTGISPPAVRHHVPLMVTRCGCGGAYNTKKNLKIIYSSLYHSIVELSHGAISCKVLTGLVSQLPHPLPDGPSLLPGGSNILPLMCLSDFESNELQLNIEPNGLVYNPLSHTFRVRSNLPAVSCPLCLPCEQLGDSIKTRYSPSILEY